MPNKNQILVAHYLPNNISGAERSIADMAEQLGRHFDFTMLTPGPGKLADYYRERGFQVWTREIQTPRRLYPGLHTLQSMAFAREVKKRGFDILIANTFSAASRIGTGASIAGVPFAIYIREFISDKTVHRRILDRADLIITISKDMQNYLRDLASPDKIALVYNFINPDPILDKVIAHRADGNRLLPYSPEHPVVGLVGRITRFKQQDLFIRAIPHVIARVPEARFVIVGGAQEKDYEKEVRDLVEELKVGELVTFMGERKDAIELTSEFSAACLTSTREPLGRVILEAQIIGCPVVASNIGGPAEIIEDEVTGLLFPPTTPDAAPRLAQQIIRVLTNADLRQRLVANAAVRIQNTFGSTGSVRLLEAHLERLSARSNVTYAAK